MKESIEESNQRIPEFQEKLTNWNEALEFQRLFLCFSFFTLLFVERSRRCRWGHRWFHWCRFHHNLPSSYPECFWDLHYLLVEQERYDIFHTFWSIFHIEYVLALVLFSPSLLSLWGLALLSLCEGLKTLLFLRGQDTLRWLRNAGCLRSDYIASGWW